METDYSYYLILSFLILSKLSFFIVSQWLFWIDEIVLLSLLIRKCTFYFWYIIVPLHLLNGYLTKFNIIQNCYTFSPTTHLQLHYWWLIFYFHFSLYPQIIYDSVTLYGQYLFLFTHLFTSFFLIILLHLTPSFWDPFLFS